jgi:secondary thiamine-phosphate synthase enzyme
MRIEHHLIEIDTGEGIAIFDLTPEIEKRLGASGIRNGFVLLSSRHTTTALTVNEPEARLLDDIRAFFQRLVPADASYKHNDIPLRDCPPDEPQNAHSHLIALLLGASENIPVVDGELGLGRWQSPMLVELDGPRRRRVNLQIVGD